MSFVTALLLFSTIYFLAGLGLIIDGLRRLWHESARATAGRSIPSDVCR
jgi:hypothetical protein